MSIHSEKIHLQASALQDLFGKRLDQALAEMFPDYSRSRLKEWILQDKVQVNGRVVNVPREKLVGEEEIEINAEIEVQVQHEGQKIQLDIVYEDEHILVMNKLPT